MKPKHYGILAIIIFIAAVCMDIWLFSMDRHHSREPFWLAVNHVLNTGLWFVIFSVLATLTGLFIMLVKYIYRIITKFTQL
jgi:hypothetical protein